MQPATYRRPAWTMYRTGLSCNGRGTQRLAILVPSCTAHAGQAPQERVLILLTLLGASRQIMMPAGDVVALR